MRCRKIPFRQYLFCTWALASGIAFFGLAESSYSQTLRAVRQGPMTAADRIEIQEVHDYVAKMNRLLARDRSPGADLFRARDKSRVVPETPILVYKPTNIVAVTLRPGVDVRMFSAAFGTTIAYERKALPNSWALRTSTVEQAAALAESLKSNPSVLNVFQGAWSRPSRRQFNPNDPYFNPTHFPRTAGQWHLLDQFGQGHDANVRGAWQRNQVGLNVLIGIIDDSFDGTHPDLAAAFSPEFSWDFGQGDADPSPVHEYDGHGISVAGVAAARGGNGIGVTGAAPFARLAGLRCDFAGGGTPTMFADATVFGSGNTAGIRIKNHSYGVIDPYIPVPSQLTALQTSAGLGTIHTWAAGNARGTTSQDSNTMMLEASKDTITVAALGYSGVFADYSNFGSSIFVTAPSSSLQGPNILTTDRQGPFGYNGYPFSNDYTHEFGGTSSAAPLVAGVLALAEAIRPNMDTRMAKHLLANTSEVVHVADMSFSGGTWTQNASGRMFNMNYGFGKVNASRLTKEAMRHSGTTPALSSSGSWPLSHAIPDNDMTTGPVLRVSLSGFTEPAEEVALAVDITHPWRGDLEIYLQSPSGTISRMISRNGEDDGNNIVWQFTSNAFWGENVNGDWNIYVFDVFAFDTGRINRIGMTMNVGRLIEDVNANRSTISVVAVPSTMTTNLTYSSAVTVRNTGTALWSSDDGYSLVSEDPLYNLTWGRNRVPLPSGHEVLPGQTFRIVFPSVAPNIPGTYSWRWRMERNGVPFGAVSPARNIVVNGTDLSRAGATVAPTTVTRNSPFTASVTFTNTGTNTWDPGTGYALVSRAPDGNTRWGFSSLVLPSAVAPGGSITIPMNCTAPNATGTFLFRWRLARSGVQFGSSSTDVLITVTP